ncbi:hypothetical protein NF673_21225 [Pseudomonas moraviensis]|nr:hypothetical protein [Pseudomonas moraviensis]UST63124.1 hypothetical protein NF673_21225 [Pseudomonas moraviensis]
MQIGLVVHQAKGLGLAGQIEGLSTIGFYQTQHIGGDVTIEIQRAYFSADRVCRSEHWQGDRPGNGADYRIDDALKIGPIKVALLQRLHGLAEEIALCQRTEILRRGLPEFRQLTGVASAEVDIPEHLQHVAAQQAHFIALIEILGLRAIRIKAAIEAEQVCIVLVGGTKTMDDQLREGERFVRLFQQVFPTGKGQRAALRRFETVEINLVRVKAGQTFVREQFVGHLPGRIKQARAGLHDRCGDGFEGVFVRCVWQQTAFGSGHVFFHP